MILLVVLLVFTAIPISIILLTVALTTPSRGKAMVKNGLKYFGIVMLLTILVGIFLSLATQSSNAASATEHLANSTLFILGIPAFLLGAYLESRKLAPPQVPCNIATPCEYGEESGPQAEQCGHEIAAPGQARRSDVSFYFQQIGKIPVLKWGITAVAAWKLFTFVFLAMPAVLNQPSSVTSKLLTIAIGGLISWALCYLALQLWKK